MFRIRKIQIIKTLLSVSFLIVFGLFIPKAVLAHQPRLVQEEGIIEIKNPTVSQAFYGSLDGSPKIFEINSANDFTLYVQLLVPQLPDIKKDLVAEIYQNLIKANDLITVLNGTGYNWTIFNEPFAGDKYYQGPEFKQAVKAEKYYIQVSRPDNLGKYVLVVGEKEQFSLNDIVSTIAILPKLKRDFFEKSPITSFFNYTGLFLLGTIIILVILVLIIVKIIKAIKQRKVNKI